MDAKQLITDTLDELMEKEVKQFVWQLWNGVTPNTEPIPKGKLERADREDVVDYMVQYYGEKAGVIAVEALRKIKQNERARLLESKLQKDQQPVQKEERNAAGSEEHQPIQSDWQRPYGVTACSQEFKMRILYENRDEVYLPVNRPQRKGLALLITNIQFANKNSNREGADKDEENMGWLLTALGYSVEKYRNLTAYEISTKVKNFSKRPEHRYSDSTFVIIMSHGTRIDNKDAIIGVNYSQDPKDVYFVDDTFSQLNSVNCPDLIDKPKVILTQACRGDQTGGVSVRDQIEDEFGGLNVGEPDRDLDAWVHKEKDFVCFMSTLPDIYAYRSPVSGSYFISYIVDVFCRSAHKDHIMELFRVVTFRMEKDQRFQDHSKIMPCIERTSLGKKFYLFPGQ